MTTDTENIENMRPLHAMYKNAFFRQRHKMAWRVPHIVKAIDSVLDFYSVVDVGCAIGDIVQGFVEAGKEESFGIEGSPHAQGFLMCDEERVWERDLRVDFSKDTDEWTTDLVLCLEVAEHIEEQYVPIFLQNIAVADQLLMSIAPPGQKGTHHYTLKPIEWWDERLAVHGYKRFDDVADKITAQWEEWKNSPGIKAYYYNLHYYRRNDARV